MISNGFRFGPAYFWTYVQYYGIFAVSMRQKLRIRVTFEPNRLGQQYLQKSYELLVPLQYRIIGARGNGVDNTNNSQNESQRRERRKVS
jgi:hypothetical protein